MSIKENSENEKNNPHTISDEELIKWSIEKAKFTRKELFYLFCFILFLSFVLITIFI